MLQESRLTEADGQALASYLASYIRETPGVESVSDVSFSVEEKQFRFRCVVQAGSGSVRMDAMFIDEGFGTLDENALRNSLQVLSDLADGKRLIGIISHVHDLEERIEKQLVVSKTLTGSKITAIV